MQNSFNNVQNDIHNISENTGAHSADIIYAGFWVRLGAYAIDSIIVLLGLLTVRFTMWLAALILGDSPFAANILFQYTLKDIVLYAAQVLYFILCTYYTGTTPGKRAMNLRVIPANDQKKLTFLNVLYRETVGRFLSGFVFGIGYIMIGIDKEKRGLHDILCDTRVIYGKRIKVYPVYPRTVQPYMPIQPHVPEQNPPQQGTPKQPVTQQPKQAAPKQQELCQADQNCQSDIVPRTVDQGPIGSNDPHSEV